MENYLQVSISEPLQCLKLQTEQNNYELRNLELHEEAFILDLQNEAKVKAHINHLCNLNKTQEIVDRISGLTRSGEAMRIRLIEKEDYLVQKRYTITKGLHDNVSSLDILQRTISDEELFQWKRKQQIMGNSSSQTDAELTQIQAWCESLAKIIWQNRKQVQRLNFLKHRLVVKQNEGLDALQALDEHLTQLLTQLVTSTFVIVKQPPQVMKTNTKFSAAVGLLVGKTLNVDMSSPQVKVSILNESQAKSLLMNGGQINSTASSGEIINNDGLMECKEGKLLTASFRSLMLKKIKRMEKRGSESVMDEKFALLFQTQFSVGGDELMFKFQVWALSLPVVVIVHATQEPSAWATIVWDNAFAEVGRVPFTVPDKVQWPQVAVALSNKYQAVTGRSLTDDNLKFLGGKALRQPHEVDNTMLLSWSQFSKELLPGKPFSFWEWFYSAMKLTKEHLASLWVDGAIIGFIWKEEAESLLLNSTPGNFLLRFSDSITGGLVIAFLKDYQRVVMLHPSTSKDFNIRGLADRIADLNELVYLYPNVTKETVFQKYYTPKVNEEAALPGYIMPYLKTHMPKARSPNQSWSSSEQIPCQAVDFNNLFMSPVEDAANNSSMDLSNDELFESLLNSIGDDDRFLN